MIKRAIRVVRNFFNTPSFRKYFVNAFWLISEKVFSLAISLVTGIYVARYLQPEAYGMLSYALSFVGIFASLSHLGIDNIMVRELTRTPERKNEILGTCYVLKSAGATTLLVVVGIVLVVMDKTPLTNTLVIIVAAGEVFKAFDVVVGFYQSKVQSKRFVRVQIIVNLVGNLLKVVLVFLDAPLIWFAVVTALNSFGNGVGYVYTYWRLEGSPLHWMYRKSVALMLARESWPVTLQGLALHTQARIDQVMLGNLMNNAEVGQYSVAMRFIEIFSFIPVMLVSTFAPAATKAKAQSETLYRERLVNFYRLMFLLFLVTATPIFFLGERVIVFLYGVEYQAAGVLFSLFSIRLLFTNLGTAKSLYVVNESLFKNSLLNAIVGAITNITVNFFLIPIYGSIGALIATVVSFTISTFGVDLFFPKTRLNTKLIFKGVTTFWKIHKIS
ncbi:MAG: flippase [Bacteroidota bacterium]|jgi:O-antigen/teichoic acid export membrane protein|nr:MAG: flippase [Bacteroidota bacterium]